MVIGNVLQSLSGSVNSIYLGQMLGVKAMAAASVFYPILFFFIALVIGLGTGASVLIGQAWGANNLERVKALMGTALVAGAVFGLVVAVVGGIFAPALLQALGTPPDILEEATRYARTMLWAAPGLFLFLLTTSMLRGVGDTLSPLLTLVISTAVGLLVTPALIRGWLGLPQVGVASAAWGTFCAYIVAMCWLGWRLRSKLYLGRSHPMAPDRDLLQHLRIDRSLLKTILKIGIPTGLQMVVFALAEIVLLSMVTAYGSHATAAYGGVNQIINYVQFPALAIAITCSILSAQSIGAGNTERLSSIVRTGLVLNLLVTGTLVLLGYAFSWPILHLFIADETVVGTAQGLLHTMLWSCVLLGASGAVSGVMRASGTVLVPTLISMGSILLVEIPVAYGLGQHLGLPGIWYGYPAAFLSSLLLQTCYYHLVWKKRPIKRLV